MCFILNFLHLFLFHFVCATPSCRTPLSVVPLLLLLPIITSQFHNVETIMQQALIDRLGKNAYPFSLDVGTLAPPSVQLIPAKRYNGAPIGTSYDVRIHMGKNICYISYINFSCSYTQSITKLSYMHVPVVNKNIHIYLSVSGLSCCPDI